MRMFGGEEKEKKKKGYKAHQTNVHERVVIYLTLHSCIHAFYQYCNFKELHPCTQWVLQILKTSSALHNVHNSIVTKVLNYDHITFS